MIQSNHMSTHRREWRMSIVTDCLRLTSGSRLFTRGILNEDERVATGGVAIN